MSSGQPEILAKGKFASMVGLSAGRISQMIASGQISPAALVGEGRSAKINVERAMVDLATSLDVSQRLGNGAGTKLAKPKSIAAPLPDLLDGDEDKQPRPASTAELYAQEKLETAKANNRRLKEQELERRGMYTLTSSVEVAVAQNIAAMLRTFEGGMVEMANDLAEKFSLPNRDVLHSMRASFNTFRKGASSNAAIKATAAPETIEDNTGLDGLLEDQQGEA